MSRSALPVLSLLLFTASPAFSADASISSGSPREYQKSLTKSEVTNKNPGKGKQHGSSVSGKKGVDASDASHVRPAASFVSLRGEEVGLVTFEQVSDAVKLHIEINKVPAGLYTVRLHEFGVCDGQKNFSGAGNSLSLGQAADQKQAASVQFPDFLVGADGKIRVVLSADSLFLSESDRVLSPTGDYLLDQDGTAVLLYRKAERHLPHEANGQSGVKDSGSSPSAADSTGTGQAGEEKKSEMKAIACGFVKSPS